MTNRKLLLLSTALVASTMFAGTAFAADETPAATPDAAADAQAQAPAATQTAQNNDNSTNVSDVIVTVNKRAENVEDVPVAVTAFTPEQRDLQGVVSIFDMTRAVPSFEYSTTLDRSFIRGVGRNTNAPGTQAGVAVYVDGVYTSSTYGLDRAPILSGTFEADAGPQSTLFGRNSIGGILQQNSVHATDKFQTQVDLRYQDHQRFDEAATIGGPLNENVKALFGVDVRNQKEGYFHNLAIPGDKGQAGGPTSERLYFGMVDFNWGKVLDGFFKLEFSGFNRKLSGFSQYGSSPTEVNPFFNDFQDSSTSLNVNEHFNCAATVAAPTTFNPNGLRAAPAGTCPATVAQTTTYLDPTNPAAANTFNFIADTRTFAKSKDNWDTAFQNTWHLPGVDAHYIGGYQQYIYDNQQDGDGTARGPFVYDPLGPANVGFAPAVTIDPIISQYYERRHWYTHELNLSNSDKSRFNWIAGVYYYGDSFHNIVDDFSPLQNELTTTFLPFSATAGAPNPNHNFYDFDYLALTQSTSGHAQFDFAITDHWKFTGGLSYNHDAEQTKENDHFFEFNPGASFSGGGGFYNNVLHQYTTADVSSIFGVNATCSPLVGSVATIIPKCTATIDPTHDLNQREISGSWDGWGGVANLTWQPNDTTLAYLKFSKGYKAGGIVLSSMNVQPLLTPETLYDYEVGYKFNPNRVITLNLAGYYYDYRNYQDFGSIPNTNQVTGVTALTTVGFNIPKSRNYGAEATLDWHPIHALTFTATGDVLDAKVVDGGNVFLPDNLDPLATGTVIIHNSSGAPQTVHYTPHPCGTPILAGGVVISRPQCITGDALKGASPWKVWLNADYRMDFSKGSLDTIVSFSDRAGNVSTYSTNPAYKAPSYNETDVRLVWEAPGGKYHLIGFVDNIFNQVGTEYQTASADSSQPAGAPLSVLLNRQLTIPRTWGVELQAKF